MLNRKSRQGLTLGDIPPFRFYVCYDIHTYTILDFRIVLYYNSIRRYNHRFQYLYHNRVVGSQHNKMNNTNRIAQNV